MHVKPFSGIRLTTILTVAAMLASPAWAGLGKAEAGSIQVTVEGVSPGQPIPEAQALCTPTKDGKSDKVVAPMRPTIHWSGMPKEAASIAVFMMDPDVPADFADAAKEGRVLPADMKRQDFFHYGIVNLPPETTQIAGGASNIASPVGAELVNDLGLNGYVEPKSAYGGPCPPWNDARVHNYHFIVLALGKDAPISVPDIADRAEPATEPNTAKNTFNRLITSKHVLAKGAVVGTYTLNQQLRMTKK